jgi:hypothetical protein
VDCQRLNDSYAAHSQLKKFHPRSRSFGRYC